MNIEFALLLLGQLTYVWVNQYNKACCENSKCPKTKEPSHGEDQGGTEETFLDQTWAIDTDVKILQDFSS